MRQRNFAFVIRLTSILSPSLAHSEQFMTAVVDLASESDIGRDNRCNKDSSFTSRKTSAIMSAVVDLASESNGSS
jgi:hypothetical protein